MTRRQGVIYTGDKHDVIAAQRPNMPSVQHYICFDSAKEERRLGSAAQSQAQSAARHD